MTDYNRIIKKVNMEEEKICYERGIDYIENSEIFECYICNDTIQRHKGIKLKRCSDYICKDCLRESVNNGSIECPRCFRKMDDAESRAFLSKDEIDKLDILLLRKAMLYENNVYRCKTPNCSNQVIIEGHLENWSCDICKLVNCLSCQAVHTNQSCVEYLNSCPKNEHIEKEIKSGNLMRCPKCKAIIEKKGGCNWIQCFRCKTELCWINQTYRWGPKGRDDISGGCKCGVNGIKCHPNCGGCLPDNIPSNNLFLRSNTINSNYQMDQYFMSNFNTALDSISGVCRCYGGSIRCDGNCVNMTRLTNTANAYYTSNTSNTSNTSHTSRSPNNTNNNNRSFCSTM